MADQGSTVFKEFSFFIGYTLSKLISGILIVLTKLRFSSQKAFEYFFPSFVILDISNDFGNHLFLCLTPSKWTLLSKFETVLIAPTEKVFPLRVNLLSLNPNLVVCDENQKELHKQLYKNNIEVIPMKLRHARTLGGSFHCVTLDTLREN